MKIDLTDALQCSTSVQVAAIGMRLQIPRLIYTKPHQYTLNCSIFRPATQSKNTA